MTNWLSSSVRTAAQAVVGLLLIAAAGIAALALGDGDLDGDRGGFGGRGGAQGGLINRPSWRLGLSGSGGEADSTC